MVKIEVISRSKDIDLYDYRYEVQHSQPSGKWLTTYGFNDERLALEHAEYEQSLTSKTVRVLDNHS